MSKHLKGRFVYRPWSQLGTLPNRPPAVSIIWIHISDVATVSCSTTFIGLSFKRPLKKLQSATFASDYE
jgi:hypothetical protein